MNRSKAYFTPSIFMLMIRGVLMLMVCLHILFFFASNAWVSILEKCPFLFEKPWLKRFSWNIS